MNCKICNHKSSILFTKKVLHKYNVNYYSCSQCQFIQTDRPFWLNEAYLNAINISDTGILHRNLNFSKTITAIILTLFDQKGKYLDYAGGYGIFTRLMRDYGFDFYWRDTYCQNLLAVGFETNIEIPYNYEFVTLLEVFEHFENPKQEIEKLFKLSKTILFSTQLVDKVDDENWWYYAPEHGQHIAFYHSNTLKYLANMYNLNYYQINGLHMITDKKISYFKLKIIKIFSNSTIFSILNRFLSSKIESDRDLLMKLH